MRSSPLFLLAASVLAAPAAAQDVSGTTDDESDEIILYHPTTEMQIVVNGGLLTLSGADAPMARDVIRPREGMPGLRVENLLRNEGGVVQFRRSDGRSAHPTSQGVTLRGLGGNAASRALVLLDGVPQADPFGGWMAWSNFDSIALSGIRVVRGGGSGLDGVGALGGTISLSSDSRANSQAEAAYGTRASYELSGNAGFANDRGTVVVDGRWSGGDGFVPIVARQRGGADRAAPYRQAGGGVRAVIFPGGRSDRLEAAVRGSYDRRDRGVDFTTSRITSVDASLRYLIDPTPYDGWLASALIYLQLRDFDTGFASVAADRSSAAPTLAQRVPATGVGARIEVRPPLGRSNPLTIGAEWRRSSGTTNEDSNFVGTTPRRNRRAGGQSDTIGLFAGYSDNIYAAGRDLSWSLSARVDRWTLTDGFRIERDIGGAIRSNDHFADRSGWQPTARAAVLMDGRDIDLRGAAYRGWRLPTLNELYRPFRVGADATAANETLKPERFTGAEIGVDWRPRGEIGLSLTAYASRLADGIANVTLAQGPGTFPGVGFVAAGGRYAQRQNIDAIRAKGIEASLDLRFDDWSLVSRYALTDAKVKASGAAAALDGRIPAQIARHNASATLTHGNDSSALSGAVTLRYIGAQNEDDLGLLRLSDVFTADAALNVRVSDRFAIDLRGENLFDAVVPAAISSGGIVERAQPRTLWFGLRLDFGG